ncbi:Short chain dehydrogenase yanD [Lachnellula suecica]|uniref:Short chain dehydrogenase yanD n=1 Tax=Lachnellula suecica TaxID=602035 RepID=A0A8T9C575_9HELO|nr:Short chain dehydrogenase yanD [Lachnellula suecica]
MTSSKSLSMQPSHDSMPKLFYKSQFHAKPVQPPKDTNLFGQVAIVTGASTGLGFHSCRQLLFLKLPHLIIAVRSAKKGEDAASKLRTEYPGAKIEVWMLEMSSYASIQDFARRVEKDLTRLDVAILNAGIVKQDYSVVESTGNEEVLQVNYLSTVLLSILLLPALKTKSPPSLPGRLTIVGSGVALFAKFPNRNEVPLLKSFNTNAKWDPSERYWVSKLLLHYFLAKLVNFVNAKDVMVNVIDPGLCKGSGLNRDTTGAPAVVMAIMKRVAGRTLELGASTYIDAAVTKGWESHGCFVSDWGISPFAALVTAPDGGTVGQRLWDETMKELEFAGPLKVLESLKY